MKELKNNKIVLGLSGGVDSTTAALLLQEKGYEVVGFYFDVLGNNTEGIEDARKVADSLGIEFISKDVSRDFETIVIDNFCKEYSKGRTPNPCIICNPNIKFKELIRVADSVGAAYIATGHYARISKDEETGKYFVRKGVSEKKDQSYMLYRLGQDVLSRLIFPLGDIENKEETRELAREKHLINADKKDSQEICFIDEKKEDYVQFIQKKGFAPQKGNFVDSEGNILGKHNGLINYTIGQRKGLGITFGKPVFVTKIDQGDNTVTLGDNETLFKKEIKSNNNFFPATSGEEFPEGYEGKNITAKIRYAAKPSPAQIHCCGSSISSIFEEPQRAATPGQSIVFYDGDIVIGGGFIE
ncbi:MAG TPA: tRNA 2-thiouridine(34) synthase MnmA [Anaerovoracaceae bacterium]|nr:tRNA 2-thiouridine(34) synthase MnmA [Anaerovoracaceae bacterium]